MLEVDGLAIRESLAICDWLDEVHPDPPLWPGDRRARLRPRPVRWVDDELTRNFFLPMRKEVFGLDDTDHPELVAHLRSPSAPLAGSRDQLARFDGPG